MVHSPPHDFQHGARVNFNCPATAQLPCNVCTLSAIECCPPQSTRHAMVQCVCRNGQKPLTLRLASLPARGKVSLPNHQVLSSGGAATSWCTKLLCMAPFKNVCCVTVCAYPAAVLLFMQPLTLLYSARRPQHSGVPGNRACSTTSCRTCCAPVCAAQHLPHTAD